MPKTLTLTSPARPAWEVAFKKLQLAWGLRGVPAAELQSSVNSQQTALRSDGSQPSILPQAHSLELGIGEVILFRGNHALELTNLKRFRTVQDVTRLTGLAADEHWMLCINTPLQTSTYLRTPTGTWVLVRYGRGFA